MPHKTFTEDELVDAERKECVSCRAPLAFVLNEATGKRTPVDLATMQSHFLTCDNPARFSRSKRP